MSAKGMWIESIKQGMQCQKENLFLLQESRRDQHRLLLRGYVGKVKLQEFASWLGATCETPFCFHHVCIKGHYENSPIPLEGNEFFYGFGDKYNSFLDLALFILNRNGGLFHFYISYDRDSEKRLTLTHCHNIGDVTSSTHDTSGRM